MTCQVFLEFMFTPFTCTSSSASLCACASSSSSDMPAATGT
eukprot:CAMPEP_0119179556 /NCGR_PEP_ID=MMETSP1315-20130426/54584_1 /TAXON_ID=676789 /ORGANISM="Prasinoderma singularis, Strain RCC927" /LENGTH=40 /DNA_ID= /DNA_START= /DNA_END= /DNA_ORIENTATION=